MISQNQCAASIIDRYFLEGGKAAPAPANNAANARAEAAAAAKKLAAEKVAAAKQQREEKAAAAAAAKAARAEAAAAAKKLAAEKAAAAKQQREEKAAAAAAAQKAQQNAKKQEAQKTVAQAKRGSTISLFGFGGGDEEKAAPAPAPPAKKPQQVSAPNGVPTLSNWKLNGDGSVSGRISGSPNFRNGEQVTTSQIAQGRIEKGSVIKTGSGSRYFLG